MTTPNDSLFGRTLSGIRGLGGSEPGTKTKLNKIVGDYKKSKGRKRLTTILLSLCTVSALGAGAYYGASRIGHAVSTEVASQPTPTAKVSSWLNNVSSTPMNHYQA